MGARRICEWIGGRVSPPFYVEDGADVVRTALVVWLEAPRGLVVGCEPIAPGDLDGAVGRVLLTVMKRPMAGSPRRPDRIRVADASLATEVRAAVGRAIRVVVRPTPEIDAFLDTMLDSMPDERSYLEGGHVSPAAVATLFTAARFLWTVKPWNTAQDGDAIRVDIPALGVDGACVSIIGALSERLGFMTYPSLDALDAFASAADRPQPETGPIDLGTDWLALGFEREADLAPTMRREAAHHRWPVSSPDAYPVVERWERDASPRPLGERDVEIVAACATSLASFFVKHEALFVADEIVSVCESYFDKNDRRSASLPLRGVPGVGSGRTGHRGGGRKYKKCHLPLDEAEHAATRSRSQLHHLDGRMVRVLSDFAIRQFGRAWLRFENDFEDPDEAVQLAAPWSVHGFRVDGRTAVEAYLETRGTRCSADERVWLEAQQVAWLSVWEVIEVNPGTSLTLRDLLSGETRHVPEVSGSQGLVVRDALLARVVDHDDGALLCGSHPRPLPPFDAAEVVRPAAGCAANGRCR